MTATTSLVITSLVIALSWFLPIASIITNRLEPSYGNALGVAYAFLAGGALHLILGVIWVAIRRTYLSKLEVALLAVSFCLLLALLMGADRGWLSKMHP